MYSGVEKQGLDDFSTNVTRIRERGFPVFGTSDIRDKAAVKRAGARWHPQRKKWVAYSLEALEQLIECKKWKPDRVESHEYRQLVEAFRFEKPQLTFEPKKRKATSPQAIDLAARAKALQQEILGVPGDEADVVKWLREEHGVDAQRIELSAANNAFGPRAGISNALRFKRAILLQQQHGAKLFEPDFFIFQQQKRARERSERDLQEAIAVLKSKQIDVNEDNVKACLEQRRRDSERMPLTDAEKWAVKRCAGVDLLLEYVCQDLKRRRNGTMPCDWEEQVVSRKLWLPTLLPS